MNEDIAPILKEFLKAYKDDRDATKETVKKLDKAVESIRKCADGMDTQIQVMKTHYTGFEKSCQERRDACGNRINKLEESVKDIGTGVTSKEFKTFASEISKEVRNLTIKVYVIICTFVGLFAVVKWVVPFAIELSKKAGS